MTLITVTRQLLEKIARDSRRITSHHNLLFPPNFEDPFFANHFIAFHASYIRVHSSEPRSSYLCYVLRRALKFHFDVPTTCRVSLNNLRRRIRGVPASQAHTSSLSQRHVVEILGGARGLILFFRNIRRWFQYDHLASLGILGFRRVAGQQGLLHSIITVTHSLAPAAFPVPRGVAVRISREARQDLQKSQRVDRRRKISAVLLHWYIIEIQREGGGGRRRGEREINDKFSSLRIETLHIKFRVGKIVLYK